jgi:uncharacterized protein (DUF2345 family)
MHWNNGHFDESILVHYYVYVNRYKHIAIYGGDNYTEFGDNVVDTYMYGKSIGINSYNGPIGIESKGETGDVTITGNRNVSVGATTGTMSLTSKGNFTQESTSGLVKMTAATSFEQIANNGDFKITTKNGKVIVTAGTSVDITASAGSASLTANGTNNKATLVSNNAGVDISAKTAVDISAGTSVAITANAGSASFIAKGENNKAIIQSENAGVDISAKTAVGVTAGTSVDITASAGAINISASDANTARNITINSVSGAVNITGKTDSTFKSSNGKVTIDSFTSTNLESTQSVNLKAGTNVNITSGYGNNTGDILITGRTKVTIQSLNSGTEINSGSFLNITAGGNITQTANDGNFTITATGGNVNISADTYAKLVAKGSGNKATLQSEKGGVDILAAGYIDLSTSAGAINIATTDTSSTTRNITINSGNGAVNIIGKTGANITASSGSVGITASASISATANNGALSLIADGSGNETILKSTYYDVSIDAGRYINLTATSGIVVNSIAYGTSLPSSGINGRIFFKLIS